MLDKNSDGNIEYRAPSKLSALIGVFLVLISVSGYVFYTKGLSDDVSTARADISSKEASISELKLMIENYEESEEELDVTSAIKRTQSLAAIPTEMYQDEVIKDLIEITETYDIELKSLSFGQGASGYEGVSSLRINASFEGNYSDLVTFLEGLEVNQRLFKVNTISVQINELDVLSLQRVTFSLNIDAFYQ